VAQELEDANIHLSISPLELGTMLARLNAGDFELASLQLPELAEPNVLRVFLHSSSAPPNGANRGRVHDDELDRLLDQGDQETDLDARRAIYRQVDARVEDRLWWIPLWHEDQVALTSPRAKSFVPSREGRLLDLANVP
jgi:peptide/nickel transport system substrate-binding protein